MRGWNICDEDLLIAQYEAEQYEYNTGFRAASPYDFNTPLERTSKRSIRKTAERTSLKSNRNNQKGNENVLATAVTPQPVPQCNLVRHVSTNSNYLMQQHPQQRKQIKKIVCAKIQALQPKVPVSQAYTVTPPSSPGIGAKVNRKNVQINYVNYCKHVANPEIIYPQVRPPCQPPITRTLKRMNTAPTLVPFTQSTELPFVPNQMLTKSVDYESGKQLKSLKSTLNLNEIKCVNTESIPDPDEYQDEYSIVVSPHEEDYFSKQIGSDSWAEYMLEDNASSHLFTNLVELKEV